MRRYVDTRERPLIEDFEPRILYSADAGALIGADSMVNSAEIRVMEATAPSTTTCTQTADTKTHEIIFVDMHVTDYQGLLDDITTGNNRQFDVITLNSDSDGVEQMASTLSERTGINAIHVITHGSQGQLQVGASLLDTASIENRYADALARIGRSLTPQGDILVYGCNFGQGNLGEAAVYRLSLATGADIAASNDLSGASTQNGDWVLEVKQGDIETSTFVAPGWNHLLAANTAPTFSNHNGVVTTDFGGTDIATAVATQPDGKILMAGYSTTPFTNHFSLLRYNTDGSLDTTFNGTGTVSTTIGTGDDYGTSIALQADGKIVVAGYSKVGTTFDISVARYNTDGSLDLTFNGSGKVTTAIGSGNDYGQSVKIQADGKILVAGYSSNGVNNDFAVVRYNSDGSLDTTFNGTGKLTTSLSASDDIGNSLVLQSDGKILVAGYSSLFNFSFVRYNSNGTLDTTLNGTGMVVTDLGASLEYATNIAVQSDGKIVLGGYRGNGGASFDFAVVRYQVNGTLDTTFNNTGIVLTDIATGYRDQATGLLIQPDGKILINGLSDPNGSGRYENTVVRYNTDGSLDTGFNGTGKLIFSSTPGTSQNPGGSTLQLDGKILIAGSGSYQSLFTLTRLNSDGSLDNTFGPIVNTLGGTVSHIENGLPAVLDSDVQIYDAELSAANNFNGATLSLGGANAQDVFSATGSLAALIQGGNLSMSGLVIGTVTSNSAGTLLLTFNTNATNSLVNSVMRQIAYSNASDSPPASVILNWKFNDNNTGAQGTGGALSASGNVTVSITAVNDAPSGTDKSITVVEDTAHVLTTANFGFSDIENHNLTAVRITSLPSSGSLVNNGIVVVAGQLVAASDIASGKLVWTPIANSNAPASFTFQVKDTGGTANGGIDLDPSPNTMTFYITPVNDAPVAANDTASGNEDTPVSGNVLTNDSDVDGNLLTASLTSTTAHGTLLFNPDGSFNYTPDANWFGTDTFTYQASDGIASSGPVSVQITVQSVNDAPVAANDTASANEDTPVSGNVLTNDSDVDGNPLTASLTSTTAHGTLLFNPDGSFNYTPDANWFGTDTFTYQASDGIASSGPVSVQITVQSVNDAPVTEMTTLAPIAQDSPARLIRQEELLATAIDLDSPTLTASALVISTGSGHLVDNHDGTWSFTPAASDSSSIIFSYVVSDGIASAPATAHMDITPVAKMPAALPPPEITPTPVNPGSGPYNNATSGPAENQPKSTANSTPGTASILPQQSIHRQDATSGPIAIAPEMHEVFVLPSAEKPASLTAASATEANVDQHMMRFTRTDIHTSQTTDVIKPTLTVDDPANLQTLEFTVQQLRFVQPDLGLPTDARIHPASPMRETMEATMPEHPGTITAQSKVELTGAIVSAGVVTWAAHLSGMFSSILATIPAWRNLDPVSVLEKNEGHPDWLPEDGNENAEESAADMWAEVQPASKTFRQT